MATPGDPFRTPALDALRAQQRRQLMSIPSKLLDRYHLDELPPASSPDAFDETAIRQLADQEARNLVELLENFEVHATVERQASFLHDRSTDDRGGLDDFQEILVELATLLAANETALFTASSDDDRAARLERFVKLVIWADQLADDGYVDRRAPRPSPVADEA